MPSVAMRCTQKTIRSRPATDYKRYREFTASTQVARRVWRKAERIIEVNWKSPTIPLFVLVADELSKPLCSWPACPQPPHLRPADAQHEEENTASLPRPMVSLQDVLIWPVHLRM